MSSEMREWLVVVIFFLFALGLIFIEAFWISRKNWAGFGKSIAFAATTNAIGFCCSWIVMFTVVLGIFMFVWDGAVNNYRYGNAIIIAAILGAALFVVVFLALCKRLFLRILKIQTGSAAWIFSFASAFLICLLWFGVPALASWIIF